jgi:tetratricopeptide (TPR) repeat protein
MADVHAAVNFLSERSTATGVVSVSFTGRYSVADVDGRGTGNGLLYGVIGALCVVVAGGGLYIYKSSEALISAQETAAQEAAKPAPAPPAPPVQAAPRPTPPPAPAGPSASQLAQARGMIGDARRLAATGNFGDAETALQNADRIIPGFAETATARREIADMRTARGQGGGQIDQAIARMRRAIERGDFAGAHNALDEAQRINANAPEVIAARRDLSAAERQTGRLSTLLATARAAIARHDYGAADRALDEAERIDARDPAVVQTRNELLEAAARPGRPPGRN